MVEDRDEKKRSRQASGGRWREASVKGRRDGDGDCHRGMGCPGESVQSLFCICILSKFISKLLSVLFVCRSKTLLELKDFLYFIFKSLCAFMCCN